MYTLFSSKRLVGYSTWSHSNTLCTKVYRSGCISDGSKMVSMVDCWSSIGTGVVIIFGVRFLMAGARGRFSTMDDDAVFSAGDLVVIRSNGDFVRVKGEGWDTL